MCLAGLTLAQPESSGTKGSAVVPVMEHIHGVHVSVDLFGLIWAQQSHGTWQTLQDMAVAMVLARESCKRRVVCFPCGNCSR